MKFDSIIKTYARYAPIYDQTFGWMLSYRGRTMAADVTNNSAGRVLEVGIGTGLSLNFYRKDHEVYGIDVSQEMLNQAIKRVEEKKLTHVNQLEIMDAQNMSYPDNHFDSVVAAYVMSVVPDPEKVIQEIERVCKPGGNVIIVNHFVSEKKGLRKKLEASLAHFSNKLGWRSDMPIDEILSNTKLIEVKRQVLPPLGLFTILQLKKQESHPN